MKFGTTIVCYFVVYFASSEGEDEVWYYSSELALDELIDSMDAEGLEKNLVQALERVRGEITRQMQLTESLTHKKRANRKSVIEMENG